MMMVMIVMIICFMVNLVHPFLNNFYFHFHYYYDYYYSGITPLTPGEYRQMAGRAGRRTAGEAFVFETPSNFALVSKLMNDQLPPVQSALVRETRSLARALLEVISLGMVTSVSLLRQYLSCTLVAQQVTSAALCVNVCESLGYLQEHEVVRCLLYYEQGIIQASRLGKAIASSCLPVEESVLIYRDLFAHQKYVSLETVLFLVFLITPTFSIPSFTWNRFDQVGTEYSVTSNIEYDLILLKISNVLE